MEQNLSVAKKNQIRKCEYELMNRDNVEIIGDMQYYIDRAETILYPQRIRIVEDNVDKIQKYVEITTSEITNSNDVYTIFVIFDEHGKFIQGTSTFLLSGIRYESNQMFFRKRIKKEIKRVNGIHGQIVSLIIGMGGEFSNFGVLANLNKKGGI